MGKTVPKAIKPEEFSLLIKQVPEKDKISRTAFLLAYGSGLRISEVINLKPENIDEGRQTINIWNSKYNVDRVVPLPKGWKEYMNKVIPIKKTMRLLQYKFKRYAMKAGLPKNYSFHSLRHGFATRMIESGVPITHIQTLLGHSDVSTTGIYTKARPQDALKSYQDLF